jgi:cyclic pyranopterin monophosphate synthase
MENHEPSDLTHLNQAGEAHMVDVGAKAITSREAIASGIVTMSSEAMAALRAGALKKGDALAVARVAGIMAAKETSRLIPLCHQIPLSSVTVDFTFDDESSSLLIQATARTSGQTGVEMEALTAVSVAALAIYDMVKAVDRAMVIGDIRLERKAGGKSGEYVRSK